eukprot:UN03668
MSFWFISFVLSLFSFCFSSILSSISESICVSFVFTLTIPPCDAFICFVFQVHHRSLHFLYSLCLYPHAHDFCVYIVCLVCCYFFY